MTEAAFVEQLRREGFQQFVTVEREADGQLTDHTHDFEAKALVLAGELVIATAEASHRYTVGDVFHLPAGTMHAERYGAQGVRYLVGRR